MRSAWDATKISGSTTLIGGASNQGFKYWNWGRQTRLMLGKPKRRGTELENKAMEKKKKKDREVEPRVSYGRT